MGIGMLGYGLNDQKVAGAETPLFARAFALHDGRRRLAYCLVDICFIAQSVRSQVLAALADRGVDLDEHHVMLAATHTHSAPGGYSHFLFYNLPVPGFSQEVLDTIVTGIVSAITEALDRLEPGHVRVAQGRIPEEMPVAFNRGLEAYNRNPEVAPLGPQDAHRAVDRTMTVVRLDSASGRPLGAFAWFGVHACSVHSDNRQLHHDNKGEAALAMERWAASKLGVRDFVAAFPQTTPGDVTPNSRWCSKRRLSVGPYDSDFDNARLNGAIQARVARQLWQQAESTPPLSGPLSGRIRYESHEDYPVDPEFAGGRRGVRTSTSCIGINMLRGTKEGPGPLLQLPWLTRPLTGLMRARDVLARRLGRAPDPHGNKFPFLDTSRGGAGRAFGLFIQGDPILPGFVDPVVHRVRQLKRVDGVGDKPWTNPIMPVQVFALGSFALVGLPGEPTTVAGARLRATVGAALRRWGVSTVVIGGYANAYSGYITTRHEYDVQRYEGASTYFGRYTLAGYRTRLRRLCQSMVDEVPAQGDYGTAPVAFSAEELAVRAFRPGAC